MFFLSVNLRTNLLMRPAWCRISSYLDSIAELGYNPIEAILIALDGNAADMIKQYDRAA